MNRERKRETEGETERQRERDREITREEERERKNSSVAEVELVHLRGFMRSESIICSRLSGI